MVLFALLLVGIFGLLGVVVDGGRLRVTRQLMDAGAECAALEGLRFKDVGGDAARRDRAISATALMFDDDLDPANGDTFGLGAGSLPIVTDAAPLGGAIEVPLSPASRAWKPSESLQANAANQQHGDLVAGQHLTGGAPNEDDAFLRGDFAPIAAGSASADLTAAPAFLVRLRRASDRLALDRQPGESSAGPPFEWLFARGASWHEPTAGQGNASRSDGLTLRSAAIAAAEPALLVSSAPLQGVVVAPFALRLDGPSAWQAASPGETLTLGINPSGVLISDGIEQGVTLAAAARRVGQPAANAPLAISPPSLPAAIVPVYGTVNGSRVVAGFTLASAVINGETLAVTRLGSAVLPAGASSTSPAANDARLALEATLALRALHASVSEPLLAPVLRR